MGNEIFLWYNAILGEYFVGDQKAFEISISKYHNDHINVLYTMEADNFAICNKIKNSLNNARVMVG